MARAALTREQRRALDRLIAAVFPEGLSARKWSTIRRFFEDAARELLPT